MKKICIVLLCLFLLPLPVMAETAVPAGAELSAGWNLIMYDEVVKCENGLFVENDRLMAGAQTLCSVLAIPYTYADGVFSIGDGAIVFKKDASSCIMNGIEVALAVTTREVGSELYVPVRFLAEAVGCQVDFHQEYAEDGTVFASVVLVGMYDGPVFDILLPSDGKVVPLFQVAATISNAKVAGLFAEPAEYQGWASACLASGDAVVVFNNEEWTLTEELKQGLLDLTPYIVTHNPEVVSLLKDKAISDKVVDGEKRIIAFPVQNGDNLEVFYVPAACEEQAENIIAYINAYIQVLAVANK